MSSKYKFQDQRKLYFVSFSVVKNKIQEK